MKILQVLPTLSAGGAESFITNLSIKLNALGCDIKIFLLAGARGQRGQVLLKRLQKAGIVVVGHEERNIRNPQNILQLISLIHSWRPDIIQANLYSAEFVTALASLLCQDKFLLLVRRLAGTNIVGHRSKNLVRLTGACFSHTICCSQAVQRAYTDLAGNASIKKSSILVNGVYAPKSNGRDQYRANIRKNCGISNNAFVFCHVGRMMGNGPGTTLETEPKAQDIILKSFARAFQGQANRHLLLVGGGRLLPEAKLLAETLDITHQVHFLGILPEPWPALYASDAFFFPSRHEGMPNSLIEAALCNLPALASDIPEIRSIFPGDSWLLKPVDHIDAFADGLKIIVDHYDDFSTKAKQIVPRLRETFSMETCAKNFLTTYKNLIYQLYDR